MRPRRVRCIGKFWGVLAALGIGGATAAILTSTVKVLLWSVATSQVKLSGS
jgi:hypothetical protein